MPFEASRYHDFSAGHRVYGHESKCAHLHGHNYRVYFHVAPDIPTKGDKHPITCGLHLGGQCNCRLKDLDMVGRVIDFGVIKDRLCNWLEENWDHRFLIFRDDPLGAVLRTHDPAGIVIVPFNPTAENMARHLVEIIAPVQLRGTGTVLVRCVVEETRKCSATYYADR